MTQLITVGHQRFYSRWQGKCAVCGKRYGERERIAPLVSKKGYACRSCTPTPASTQTIETPIGWSTSMIDISERLMRGERVGRYRSEPAPATPTEANVIDATHRFGRQSA